MPILALKDQLKDHVEQVNVEDSYDCSLTMVLRDVRLLRAQY